MQTLYRSYYRYQKRCESCKWSSCRRSRAAAALHHRTAETQASHSSAAAPAPSFSYRVSAKQAATKLRLDTFLATQIAADLAATGTTTASSSPAAAAAGAVGQEVSRAKIQASISEGLVKVNGRPAVKPSLTLRAGDQVECRLLPPPPLQAVPEDIPLDVRYEDEHLLVINKPAGMVVHVAPGHHTGTLVNALLHHCALPPMDLHPESALLDSEGSLDPDLLDVDSLSGISAPPEVLDGDDDEDYGEGVGDVSDAPSHTTSSARTSACSSSSMISCSAGDGGILRPGIVHRLDKGTSGLLVVAKTEVALRRLQAQFKARTVDRLYLSITVGFPQPAQGRVETNIVRDPRDRKRMAAAPYGSGRGRTAASNYWTEKELAGGGAALVRWKLDTGRTHQIRVHARHIGHPLVGDETYGGTATAAVAAVSARKFPADQVRGYVQQLGRPALHALTLGFTHPLTGQRMDFEQPPPPDFELAVAQLQGDL